MLSLCENLADCLFNYMLATLTLPNKTRSYCRKGSSGGARALQRKTKYLVQHGSETFYYLNSMRAKWLHFACFQNLKNLAGQITCNLTWVRMVTTHATWRQFEWQAYSRTLLNHLGQLQHIFSIHIRYWKFLWIHLDKMCNEALYYMLSNHWQNCSIVTGMTKHHCSNLLFLTAIFQADW